MFSLVGRIILLEHGSLFSFFVIKFWVMTGSRKVSRSES